MDTQATETLSPLAEFGQRIYERALEARRKENECRAKKLLHQANRYKQEIAVLVELHNDFDRTRSEAEKADDQNAPTAVIAPLEDNETKIAFGLRRVRGLHLG